MKLPELSAVKCVIQDAFGEVFSTQTNVAVQNNGQSWKNIAETQKNAIMSALSETERA